MGNQSQFKCAFPHDSSRTFFLILFLALIIGFSTAIFAELSAKHSKSKSHKPEVITSSRMEFDNEERVFYFEGNVIVKDNRYTLTADRMIVFLEDGTNELRQIHAIGNVFIVSDERTGSCPEAVYTKNSGQVIMFGPNDTSVQLTDNGDKIWGRKITFWLEDQRMVCVPARLALNSVPTDRKTDVEELRKTIPEGKYSSTTSADEMVVSKETVRIRREKSTWSTLCNNPSGKNLYDVYDLEEAHPMRLKLLNDNRVEFVRDESPPYTKLHLIFVRPNE